MDFIPIDKSLSSSGGFALRLPLIVKRVIIKYPVSLMNKPAEQYPCLSATSDFARNIFEQYRAAKLNPRWVNKKAPLERNKYNTVFEGIEIDTYPDIASAPLHMDAQVGAS
jgi:hypothetical protein